MFAAANVLDLKAHPVIAFMEQAILAKTGGTFPNLPAKGGWNMLAHADTAATRARAFTRDMIWLSI